MTILFFAVSIISLLLIILALAFRDEYRRRQERRVVATMDRYWDGKDRRKFIRVTSSVSVNYKLESPSRNNPAACRTSDISEGGIGVTLLEKFQEGDVLKLMVELPDEPRPLACQGRVAWIKESHIDEKGRKNFDAGLEFLNMREEDKAKLKRHIEYAGEIQR